MFKRSFVSPDVVRLTKRRKRNLRCAGHSLVSQRLDRPSDIHLPTRTIRSLLLERGAAMAMAWISSSKVPGHLIADKVRWLQSAPYTRRQLAISKYAGVISRNRATIYTIDRTSWACLLAAVRHSFLVETFACPTRCSTRVRADEEKNENCYMLRPNSCP